MLDFEGKLKEINDALSNKKEKILNSFHNFKNFINRKKFLIKLRHDKKIASSVLINLVSNFG